MSPNVFSPVDRHYPKARLVFAVDQKTPAPAEYRSKKAKTISNVRIKIVFGRIAEGRAPTVTPCNLSPTVYQWKQLNPATIFEGHSKRQGSSDPGDLFLQEANRHTE